MISVNVYEVGDVIKIKRDNFRLEAKRRTVAESGSETRAIVMGISQRIDKLYSYKLVTASGKTIVFTPHEQGQEEYIGHVDLGLLFPEKDG
jgi:hypothetical protein